MSDFRIGGRGGYRQGGVNRPEQPQQREGCRDGAQGPDGGPQSGSRLRGAHSVSADSMSPELQARLRDRRTPMPPSQDWQEAFGPDQSQEGVEPAQGDRRGPGRPHGRHGGFDGPREQRDPAQAAEAFITRFDTNGDGSVTKDEVTAALQAEQAKQQAQAVTAPAVEETTEAVDTTEPVETTDTTVTPDDTATEESATTDYGQVQSELVAQLQTLQQQEGLTDEQKQLVDTALTTVQGLDPADADFASKLNEALAPLS